MPPDRVNVALNESAANPKRLNSSIDRAVGNTISFPHPIGVSFLACQKMPRLLPRVGHKRGR